MDGFIFFSLAVASLLFVFQIGRRRWQIDFLFWAKTGFFANLAAAAVYYGYLVYNQYFVWFISGPPTIYLLPPYESIGYVFYYHLARFGLRYGVSAFAALIFLAAAIWHNRRRGGRFFEKEEPYLGASGIFLAGTPGELYYFVGLLVLYLLIHLGFRLFGHSEKESRLPLYWLWLPPAILVIIMKIVFNLG